MEAGLFSAELGNDNVCVYSAVPLLTDLNAHIGRPKIASVGTVTAPLDEIALFIVNSKLELIVLLATSGFL